MAGYSLPQQPEQARWRALGLLQGLQSRDQPLLDIGEIAAEWKRGQQARIAGRAKCRSYPVRIILAIDGRNLEILMELSGAPGLPLEFVLKAGIGDLLHRCDHVGVGFSPDVGHAVFRDDDIAPLTRYGLVAVAPANVRLQPGAGSPRGFERENGARPR